MALAAIIPAIVAVASIGTTIYSTVASSQAEAKAERNIKRQNLLAAERQKEIAEYRAADEEKRMRAIMGTQEARYAASGLTEEGSPLLVEMESQAEMAEQLRRIKEGGDIGYMTYRNLAQAAGTRAKEAKTSGYVSAAGQAATGLFKWGRSYDWW